MGSKENGKSCMELRDTISEVRKYLGEREISRFGFNITKWGNAQK